MEKMKIKERVNWPVTILLLLGLITVAFPLYMTIVIALKKPSEMTNSISGILSLPSHLSLDNFAEAMRVTDFWHSLGNSVFITLVTVVLSILIHSLLGYAIGRNKKSKFYKFIYFLCCQRNVCSICNSDDACCKTDGADGTGKQSRSYYSVRCILYAYECIALFRISYKYPVGIGRSSLRGWCEHMENVLEDCFPNHETNACDSCSFDSTWYMERCNDTTRHHVRFRKRKYTSAGTAELPDTVWNKL